MDLFTFDTTGDKNLINETFESIKSSVLGFKIDTEKSKINENLTKYDNEMSEDDDDDEEDDDEKDYGGLPPPSKDISHIIEKALKKSAINDEMKKEDKQVKNYNAFLEYMGWNDSASTSKANKNESEHLFKSEIDASITTTNVEEVLKDSKLKGIEKEHNIECLSERKARQARKEERLKTKGKDWFNMPATEKTEEIENDLKILQMRSALNPKQFYKKNDLKVLPKYFQIGTVQHSPLNYYNERDTKRNKKRTIVDELMADADFQRYNKRKYKEVMEKNQKNSYNKAMKKMKKLKKKK